jgi:hypothetical protein
VRKALLTVLILAVIAAGSVNWLSRRSPELLRAAIGRAIHKTVQIDAIEYRFPWTFELMGFRILETHAPFAGEPCFMVDRVLLEVQPLSLSGKKELVVDSIEVDGAHVFIRKKGDKLYHALSDAMTGQAESPTAGEGPSQPLERQALAIKRFKLTDGSFRFADYDVQSSGFVVELDQIRAIVEDLSFPPSNERTDYSIQARLPQGRQERQGRAELSGWTVFADHETDALLKASDISLSYFKPYYAQVTDASIDQGWLSARQALRIHEKTLTANTDLELSSLYFSAYEEGEQLFGLKAEEILGFLKDSSGNLKFQFVLQWPLQQRGLERRAVIRRAIEQSLKKTLLGNVGNILERTLQKLSSSGLDAAKDDWEDALKKVKKLAE